MKGKRHTKEEKIRMPWEVDGGKPIWELCRLSVGVKPVPAPQPAGLPQPNGFVRPRFVSGYSLPPPGMDNLQETNEHQPTPKTLVSPGAVSVVRLEDSDVQIEEEVPEFDPVFEIGSAIDETFPALGGAAGEEIRVSVSKYGMDALGWYVPFHYPGAQWGAHISLSGIAYLLREAFGKLDAPFLAKINMAFHAILSHELFHFATEYAIAQAELAHKEPWYIPTKKYFRDKTPDYSVVEEKLANAYMLRSFRTRKPSLLAKGKQEALRGFTKNQPEGYRDGWRVRRTDLDDELKNLAKAFGDNGEKGRNHPLLWSRWQGFDWPAQFPVRPGIDWRYCPIHLVHDGQRLDIPDGWLSCFSRLEHISEGESFRKKLEKLADPIQKAWHRTKEKLRTGITGGLDFKKWPKAGEDVFSVRVNAAFRAHLKRVTAGDWSALDIGNHKEMGHG